MFVSLNWLKEFVSLPEEIDPQKLGKLLTVRSAEVEGVVDQGEALKNVVVGKVTKISAHPNADKLRLAMVDLGNAADGNAADGKVQIVCGGSNLKEGMLGAIALPGAIVKWHGEEAVEVKEAKIRGETSYGMICTAEELGLPQGEDERELMDLSGTNAKPGTPVAKVLGLDDTVIEFDNKALTHRPDLWGHIGIAREIAAITGSEFKVEMPQPELPESDDEPLIAVKNPELCPRYMGVIIRGVKVEQSPDWLKKRLIATDHSLISNIVDVTNYVMEEVGQPMHAFDLRKIKDGIVVRTAKKGEKMTTLDGEKHELDAKMLVIADSKKVLAVAGVMGGEDSGIQEDTVDILLESANFDPVSVRQTGTKLGLRTDSVQRFEKSLDPRQCKHAILRAVELILRLCPNAKAGAIADIACFDESEPLITIDPTRICNKIGVNIPVTEMAGYLTLLGFEIQGKVQEGSQQLLIKIPSFRATKDVDIEDDIVEEVARMYGYEKIPAVIPELPAKSPRQNVERRNKHDAREIFAHALGYYESYNYSFYGANTVSSYDLGEKTHLKLANILSEDQSHLRVSMIPNLIRSLREACKYEENPMLFELGRTYTDQGEFMPNEKKMIAAVRVFSKKGMNCFMEIKGDLEQFLELFGVKDASFKENPTPTGFMHPYQNALITLRGKEVGSIFTLHPSTAEAEDFDGRVACFELDFQARSAASALGRKYKAESKFPAIEFDVSVLLKRTVTVANAEEAMRKHLNREILKKITLFDIYEGDKIGAENKSLAFRLTLQSNERTLTGEDLNKAQKQTWKALEKLGGKIRK